MTEEPPNIFLLKRLDLCNLAAAKGLIAEDAVWHFFNPNLPDLQGDYVGLDGNRSFFEAVGEKTRGTFRTEPVSITAVGDELVASQNRNTLTFQGRSIALDMVVVWRVLGGQIVEVRDIVPGQPTVGNDAGH